MAKKKSRGTGRPSKSAGGDLKARKNPKGGAGGVPGAPSRAGGVPGVAGLLAGGVPGIRTPSDTTI